MLNTLQVKIDRSHHARRGWGERQNLLLELMKRVEKDIWLWRELEKVVCRAMNAHKQATRYGVHSGERNLEQWFDSGSPRWHVHFITLKQVWWWDNTKTDYHTARAAHLSATHEMMTADQRTQTMCRHSQCAVPATSKTCATPSPPQRDDIWPLHPISLSSIRRWTEDWCYRLQAPPGCPDNTGCCVCVCYFVMTGL